MAKQLLSVSALGTSTILSTVTNNYSYGITIDSIGRIVNFPTPAITTGSGVTSISGTVGRTNVNSLGLGSSAIGLYAGVATAANYLTSPVNSISIDSWGRVTTVNLASVAASNSVTGGLPLASITVDDSGRVSKLTALTVSDLNLTTATFVITGVASFGPTAEKYSTITNATGVVTHDFSKSQIWYHNSILGNFTANFTNFYTTSTAASPNNTYIINLSIFLEQGATPYMCNAVQINGVAQTVKWFNNTVPTGVANFVESVNFTIFSTVSNVWTVLGSKSNWA